MESKGSIQGQCRAENEKVAVLWIRSCGAEMPAVTTTGTELGGGGCASEVTEELRVLLITAPLAGAEHFSLS